MKIVKMETHMLSQKVIANVTPEFARVYNIPEGHTSVGFFSADNDDIGYLAVDDASKKANIKLIHAETYYGGTTCSWSKYGGSVFVLFSGPKVEDVKSGLRYVRDFIENHSELCNFDGDEGTAFYAQTIPRPGKYFQEWCELKPGESYAYLVGGPIETNYALDKALKAGNTRGKILVSAVTCEFQWSGSCGNGICLPGSDECICGSLRVCNKESS